MTDPRHDRLDALLSIKLHCAQLARELDGAGLPKSAERIVWVANYVQTEIVQEEKKIGAIEQPQA